MPRSRKNIPSPGAEADEDLKPDFNYEEMMRGVLEDLGDIEPPKREKGWLTVNELLAESKALTRYTVWDRLDKLVKDGKYERRKFHNRIYFRKIVNQED